MQRHQTGVQLLPDVIPNVVIRHYHSRRDQVKE